MFIVLKNHRQTRCIIKTDFSFFEVRKSYFSLSDCRRFKSSVEKSISITINHSVGMEKDVIAPDPVKNVSALKGNCLF